MTQAEIDAEERIEAARTNRLLDVENELLETAWDILSWSYSIVNPSTLPATHDTLKRLLTFIRDGEDA